MEYQTFNQRALDTEDRGGNIHMPQTLGDRGMGTTGLTIEELEETLIPMFYAVVVYTYDPTTAVAYIDKDMIPSASYRECLDYIRDIATMLLPEIIVVDIGYVYTGSHTNIHAWWIQFKL
jgi:hypothetical protein